MTWTADSARLVLAVGLLLLLSWEFPAVAAPVITGDLPVADQAAGTVRSYSTSGADLGVFASVLSQDNHG